MIKVHSFGLFAIIVYSIEVGILKSSMDTLLLDFIWFLMAVGGNWIIMWLSLESTDKTGRTK